MKSIAYIIAACCFCLAPALSFADAGCPEPEQAGPCVCYCPMVKYVPRYHCEQKCYTEPYQVSKKCCRYVPQYYTKTYCKQVPEYYYTSETKYRKRYYSEKKCTYVPQRYVVKKTIDCPASASCAAPIAENYGCETPISNIREYSRGSSCPTGGCGLN